MKKLVFIGMMIALCTSCRTRPGVEKQPVVNETPKVEATEVVTDNTPLEYVSYTEIKPTESFYRSNITVKTMGKDYVIYEYSDVKIEEVATLASRYCFETNPGKSAYLRDIYMHKNRKRRATFDCVDLAGK